MDFTRRDILERRYDGPIPPADPAATMATMAGRVRLFLRLAAETREKTATRRSELKAASVAGDRHLGRLQHDLRLYRGQSVAWHDDIPARP